MPYNFLQNGDEEVWKNYVRFSNIVMQIQRQTMKRPFKLCKVFF